MEPASPPATDDTASAATPIEPASPLATLPTGSRSVVRLAFDLLTRSNADLRRSSFYLGLIVIGTIGPVVLLLWGAEITFGGAVAHLAKPPAQLNHARGWIALATWLAVAGFVVALIESRGIAIAVLGARLAGRPVTIVGSVERSRRVFWRVVGATLLVSLPLGLVEFALGVWLAGVLHGASEITVVSAGIVAGIIGTPFAYVLTGIVLGDVGVVEAAKRSIRLFSVRRRAALVVSLFAFAAQLLTGIGLLAGLDVVFRVFDVLGLGPDSGDIGVMVSTLVIIALVFAAGTLQFTVTAMSMAPQVVMFLALTHATPGLDRARSADAVAVDLARGERKRPHGFRWLTRPMLVVFVAGAITLIGGLVSMSH